MKVVLFVNSLKTFYWHRQPLAQRLIELGHEVLIITSRDEEPRISGPQYQFKFIDLSRKGTNPLAELKSLASVTRILIEFQPDILHNFTVKSVIYGSLGSLFLRKVKVINSITGLGSAFIRETNLSKLIRFFYKTVFKLTDSTVIFLNEDDRNYFLNYKIVSDFRTYVIRGDGVDLQKFSVRNCITSKPPRIFFASRLLKDKGLLELISAVKLLKTNGNDFQLVIAGDVDPGNPTSLTKEEFTKLIEGLPVIWVGLVQEVLPFLESADIVTLPSYREGVPMSLLEAAACGIPMVATDVPGCRDVVIDGVTGLLAKVQNAEDLAFKLECLLKDSSLRIIYGSNARKHVEKHFGKEAILAQILDLYF